MAEAARVDDSEQAGRVAGTLLGLFAGARAGSTLVPFPMVGPFVGAVAGAILGDKAARLTGRFILRGTASLAGAVSSASEKVADSTAPKAK